jgi:hypothetical protein
MRWALIFIAALALAGCGAEAGAPSASGTLAQLTVRLDADGPGPGKARELRLSCDSAKDSSACGTAAGLRASDFTAVPADRVCTDIFGGPETASVSGELRGESVRGDFRRQNGCEIKRWKAIAGLLP